MTIGTSFEVEDLLKLDTLTKDVPWTHTRMCHLLYKLALTFEKPEIFEVACCYGKATAYLATAAMRCGGTVVAVDLVEGVWQGKSTSALLEESGAIEVCNLNFGQDARWYILELFTKSPEKHFDLVYLDLSHIVEVDAFVALATWLRLRPGGIFIVDDLDWIPSKHGTHHMDTSYQDISHMEALFTYISNLHDVGEVYRWGKREIEWTLGILRKQDSNKSNYLPLPELIKLLDNSKIWDG